MHFAARPLGASFTWKPVLGLAFVALGDWLLYQGNVRDGTAGVLALALLAALLAGRPAVRANRAAWLTVLCAAVFALALAWNPGALAWTLFLVAAGMATLLPQTCRFDDGWRWSQRVTWLGLRVPLRPLIDARRIAKLRTAGRGRRIGLRKAASLLAMPLIGGAIIVALFCLANPVFARLASALVPWEMVFPSTGRLLNWALFFAMAWSLLRPSLLKRPLPLFDGRGDLRLPGFSAGSVTISLVVFNLIFALQNLLDAAYLWGMAELPKGMTLADYAHRGAYPLIATALLAALFVLFALRPGSVTAGNRTIRRLVTLWIAQNIVLVASSIQRTVDYVEAYSLTRLRIAALAWMVLVAFGLATICWRLLRDRSAAWLVNINLAATTAILTIACFVDLGALAAEWNVRHAREVGGAGAALDLCYLGQQGNSALLPLLELERRPDLRPDFRERVQAVRIRVENEDSAGAGLLRAWRHQQANALSATLPLVQLAKEPRGCDGSLRPVPAALPTTAQVRMPADIASDPAAAGTRAETEAPR